jgi:RHS repeat-associated protein
MTLCNINIATGSVYLGAIDLLLRGPIPFRFERDYDSARLERSAFGQGWRHSQVYSLILQEREAILILPAARRTIIPHPNTSSQKSDKIRTTWDEYAIIVTDPQDNILRFERPNGLNDFLLRRQTDPRGNYLAYNYWPDGVLQSVTDARGRSALFAQDLFHRIRRISLKLPDSHIPIRDIAEYEFNESGNLVFARSLNAGEHQYRYEDNKLVEHVNPLGGRIFYWYDKQGRCIRTSRDDGTHKRFIVWNKVESSVSIEDSRGATWTYKIGPNNTILSEVDPLGRSVQHSYDENGNLQFSARSSAPYAMSLFFPERRFLFAQKGPLLSTFSFDVKGRLVESTKESGVGWSYKYDQVSNRIEAVNSLNAIWKFAYDPDGWLYQAIDPLGHVLKRIRPDPLSVEYVDDIGLNASLQYDWSDRLVKTSDGMGHQTRYIYSDSNLPVSVIYSDDSSAAFSYDAMGNMTIWREEGGNETRFTYDRFGTPISVMNAAGRQGFFQYDTEGNLLAITNFKNEVATFEHNLVGECTKITLFDGRTYSYERDQLGAPSVVMDSHQNPILAVNRDEYGRIIKKIHSEDWEAHYEWGEHNQLLSARTPMSSTTFEWTPELRLSAEKCDNFEVRYEYDMIGNCIALTTGDGRRIEYGWDARKRLIFINDVDKAQYNFFYSDDNLIRKIVAPHVIQEFEFDKRQRATRRTVLSRNTNKAIADRKYKYNESGRLIEVEDLYLGLLQYIYDKVGAVIRINSSLDGHSELYEYDQNHNLVFSSTSGYIEYGAGDCLARCGGREFSYNNFGAVSTITYENQRWKLGYNPQGELVNIGLSDGRNIEYKYDSLGRRLSKKDTLATTKFYWSQMALLEEKGSFERKTYLFMPGTFLPLGMDFGAEHFTFILDQAGTPTEIIGAEGNVAWRGHFSLFGDAYRPDIQRVRNPFRFQGQYYDSETGFHYNRFRYYYPPCGRYLSPDPLGFSAGTNLYRYVINPLQLTDPLGLYNFSNGVLEIHSICNWSPEQYEDADKKMRAMNSRLSEKGGVTFPPKPHARCAKTAKSIYEKCQESGDIPKTDEHNLNEGGGKCHNQQADHVLEICMDKGGEEDCANMQPLNESVNKSYGAQVGAAVAANPGAVLTKVVLLGEQHCKDNPNTDCR